MVLCSLITLVLLFQPLLADQDNIFRVLDPIHGFNATAVSIKTEKRVVLITNRHVCENNTSLLLENSLIPGTRFAVVVTQWKKADLCMLTSVTSSGYRLASYYTFGEQIKIVGYPAGEFMVSTGKLIDHECYKSANSCFLHANAAVAGGSSGSPAFNNRNEIVGIVAVGHKDFDNYSGLVPLEAIKQFIKETFDKECACKL